MLAVLRASKTERADLKREGVKTDRGRFGISLATERRHGHGALSPKPAVLAALEA